MIAAIAAPIGLIAPELFLRRALRERQKAVRRGLPDALDMFVICLDAGWPFTRWTRFSEIDLWLAGRLAAFALDPGALSPLPPDAPPPNGYFCGPEVWGDGLLDPPDGAWPPR